MHTSTNAAAMDLVTKQLERVLVSMGGDLKVIKLSTRQQIALKVRSNLCLYSSSGAEWIPHQCFLILSFEARRSLSIGKSVG